MAESKSAKKNKKRRAGGKKSGGTFEVEEDVSLSGMSSAQFSTKPPVDPIGDLKRQIEEAKAAKDHEKAQELRHKMWVLQDTIALGKAGPGAPEVDLKDVISNQQEPARSSPQPLQSSSGDPTEKKLSRLQKKLHQVKLLKERRDNGEKLEANQLTKIEGEQDLLDEIAILEGLLTGSRIV